MTSTRPRGFIDGWVPSSTIRKDKSGTPLHSHSPAEIVSIVQSIIIDNDAILPLTLRQIFYIMLGHGYTKSDKSYKRLCEIMNKARRARLVDLDVIRDDGFTVVGEGRWNDEESLIEIFKANAKYAMFERQMGQDVYLMLWCEAAGMVPQLANATRKYSVPVHSSGGFDSLTTKHDMAEKISDFEEVEILHIGDHDPSGVHICSSLDEDMQAFLEYYGGTLTVTRLAATPEQIAEMSLPTAPVKSTDRRSFSGETTQAEAIPPSRLREIVTEAIDQRIDFNIYDDLLEVEQAIRDDMAERLENI
jgi:hypothetical protein